MKTLSNRLFPDHSLPFSFIVGLGLVVIGCSSSPSEAPNVLGTQDSILTETEVIKLKRTNTGSTNQQDAAAEGKSPSSKLQKKDEKSTSSANSLSPSDLATTNGTWILSSSHHLGGQLDGKRLVQYFEKQKKDIDKEVFLTKPAGVSLKNLKRITFAVNQSVLGSVKNAAISGSYNTNSTPADWVVLVQFDKSIPKNAWQNWLVPVGQKEIAMEERIFVTSPSSKMGLVWTGEKEFLFGNKTEIQNCLKRIDGHVEVGKIARSIAKQQGNQLVYFAMEMQPFRKMVADLARMAEQYYPSMVQPYKKEIAAVSGWEYTEFTADLSEEKFGNLQLHFSDSPETKIFQEFINKGLAELSKASSDSSTGSAISNSLLPNLSSEGSGGGGIGTQLQKLALEIKDELLQGGTKPIEEEKIAGLRFHRPKKLDKLVTSAMEEFRTGQADWIRVARVQKIYEAIYQYQQKNKSFPPKAFFGSNPQKETSEKNSGFSWRVAILPALGYEELFKKFRFEEPWNSVHNKEIAKEIPIEFCGHAIPSDTDPNPCSCFQLIGGKKGLLGDTQITSFDDIPDDADRTFLLIQAQDQELWTKPSFFDLQDLPTLDQWNQARKGIATMLLASGRIVMLPGKIDTEKLLPWFTPAGKERIRRKLVLQHTVVQPSAR